MQEEKEEIMPLTKHLLREIKKERIKARKEGKKFTWTNTPNGIEVKITST
jgi:hypothetical protein